MLLSSSLAEYPQAFPFEGKVARLYAATDEVLGTYKFCITQWHANASLVQREALAQRKLWRRDCNENGRFQRRPPDSDNPPVTTTVVTAPFTQRGLARAAR